MVCLCLARPAIGQTPVETVVGRVVEAQNVTNSRFDELTRFFDRDGNVVGTDDRFDEMTLTITQNGSER